MQCSAKEIETVLTNASIGAGLPAGLSDDVGRAGAWLQRRGYDGLAAVWQSIGGGIKQPPTIHYDAAAHTFHNAQIALCGAAVFDLLAVLRAAAESPPPPILLQDVDSPWLLVGLAGVAATDYDLCSAIQFTDGAIAEVTAAAVYETAAGIPPQTAAMRVTLANRPPESIAIQPRVTVDKRHWQKLQALAAQTFVPSNTESRAKGAGAGLTDND